MQKVEFYNNQFINAGDPVVSADSRALRYGDGLFETIKVLNGKLLLAPLHFERLFKGLATLNFDTTGITPNYLSEIILQLCQKNNTQQAARVRLSMLRSNGSPYELQNNQPQLLVQCWPLAEKMQQYDQKGLNIAIYPDARKSCDIFSNLKSNNYLPYLMGAQFANAQQLDDAVLLNVFDRICDATIANIAWVKNETIFTPPLSEGCIAGVLRRYLLENAASAGFMIIEQSATVDELLNADEIFLTNAISGIRWVEKCEKRNYQHFISEQLFRKLLLPLYR